jgi:hypothetical protein
MDLAEGTGGQRRWRGRRGREKRRERGGEESWNLLQLLLIRAGFVSRCFLEGL